MTDSDPSATHTTANQVVAYNMAAFRKAAGMTQEELGELLGGWSAASVSAAERSWDGKRVKKFDADEVAAISWVLGVPLIALFLPPPDGDGEFRFAVGPEVMDAARMIGELLYPDNPDDAPAMHAYRDRWHDTLAVYVRDDPEWTRLAARWLADIGTARAERADRLRRSRDALLRAAAEFADLADAIENTGGPHGPRPETTTPE